MSDPCQMLATALARPETLAGHDVAGWNVLIPVARRADLLARLCLTLEKSGGLDRVPEAPRRHLEGAALTARKHGRDVVWEVKCIADALSGLGVPVFLLKGAAYVMAGLPAARGRLFGDVDIMIPKPMLPSVEKALRIAGWWPGDIDEYDQHYYRTWMHQIPPLSHIKRGTTIDVHHTIVPETARIDIHARKLRDAAVPIPGHDGIWVLGPTDMVLHSATHLFNEGEFEKALRDLSDLDLLMRHFAARADFWPDLVSRAHDMDLARPLYYALHSVVRIFATPVPDNIMKLISGDGPGWPLAPLMDALWRRALTSDHPACRAPGTGLGLLMLYVRAHHLRMPAHLLLPHLLRKALKREGGDGEDEARS